MGERLSSPEAQEKKISTTYIDLARHGNRFAGKKFSITFYDHEELTFDDPDTLTPEGESASLNFGNQTTSPETQLVHARGSDTRHGLTGDLIQSASRAYGPKREKNDLGPSKIFDDKDRVKKSREGIGMGYKSTGIWDEIKPYAAIVNAEAQKLISKQPPEIQDKIKIDPKIRAKFREKAQDYGFRQALKKENITERFAENTAYELMHSLLLSRRGIAPGTIASIPIVTSGMFPESLYKQALVVEDEQTGEKKVGFDDVDEIGGFTKQATAFRIKLSRDDTKGNSRRLEDFDKDTEVECEFVNDPERAKLFEGKKVYLDWDKVRELAKAAEERFVEEGLVKKSIFTESKE